VRGRLDWIDDCIAIGNLVDANNVGLLKRENIDLIIDVRTAFDFGIPGPKLVCEKAEKIANLLIGLSELKAKVLVRCLEGIDRTPFIVMLYIAKKNSMSLKDAYNLVKQKSAGTRVHSEWLKVYEDFLQSSKK
jgi:protein-tyrosine phosphatase